MRDLRILLKAITGCPILKLGESNWSKIKNIKKHANVFGFVVDHDDNIHRIAGA
jgi:hypothetical protein